MIQLSENIKSLRRHRGMSQEELAFRTGYADKTAISRIENGKTDIPQSKIMIFAEALGVTATFLMGWDDNPLGISEIDALNLYTQLNEEGKSLLLEHARLLLAGGYKEL